MKNKCNRPAVSRVCRLDSKVHYCREAALIRLSGGRNRLKCREYPGEYWDYYDICLENHCLAGAKIETVGTSADMLYQGYGAENISLDECFSVRDGINSGFNGLWDSIETISPIIGLLSDGYYVIGDFELFPVIGGEHFWNGQYDEKSLLHYLYAMRGGDEFYDAPACFFPTERAALFDEERVKRYIDRLEEGIHFPRAIAYYLSGCMSLLLDGHHKAAAAAAVGKMARCLVIMSAELDIKRYQETQERKERLFLTHNKSVGVTESGAGPLLLCDKSGNKIGGVCGVTDTAVQSGEEERYLYRQESQEEWGEIPMEYCRNLDKYPSMGTFEQGTLIPPDRIMQEFAALAEGKDRECDRVRNIWRARRLLAYCKLFPDNKWITESQREWIQKIKTDLEWGQ